MFHIKSTALVQAFGASTRLRVTHDLNIIIVETGEIIGRFPAMDQPFPGAETHDLKNIPNRGVSREKTGAAPYSVKELLFPGDPSQAPQAEQKAHCQAKAGNRRPKAEPPCLHLSKSGKPWFDVSTYAGKPVSKRVIRHGTRLDAIAGAGFAADSGHPLTMFLTQHPKLDEFDPAQRLAYWNDMRQMLAVVAQKCGIPFHWLRVRESDPDTNDGEHAHWLIHVPADKIERWTKIVKRKCPNTHVKAVTWLPGLLDYVLKAAEPRTRMLDPTTFYRRSGAVLGDRVAMSMSIKEKRRTTAYEADPALVVRRDDRVAAEITQRRIKKEEKIAAGRRRRESQVRAMLLDAQAVASEMDDTAELQLANTHE